MTRPDDLSASTRKAAAAAIDAYERLDPLAGSLDQWARVDDERGWTVTYTGETTSGESVSVSVTPTGPDAKTPDDWLLTADGRRLQTFMSFAEAAPTLRVLVRRYTPTQVARRQFRSGGGGP